MENKKTIPEEGVACGLSKAPCCTDAKLETIGTQEKYKPHTWYWVTDPREGDTWYPIYITEVYWMMDGKPNYDFTDLEDLLIEEAMLPTE